MKQVFMVVLFFIGGKLCIAQNEHTFYLHFNSTKHFLTKAHTTHLDSLMATFAQKSIESIQITGHTDWVGSVDYNKRLSQKRAEATRDFLADKVGALSTVSFYGEEKPVADNAIEKERVKNRRVEIIVKLKPVVNEGPKLTENIVPETSCKERDTLYESPGGAQVYLSSCCLPNGLTVDDIEINVTEALTPQQMRATRTTTRDTNRNCLVSGGMVYVSITNKKTGKPIEKIGDSCMVVRIPAPTPDPEMDFYLSNNQGKSWEKSAKGNMKIENINGKSFYSFSGIGNIGRGIGFNPDKLAVVPLLPFVAVAAGLSAITDKILKYWKPGYIKTKGIKQSEGYISTDSSILEAKYIKNKVLEVNDCGCMPEGQQVVSVYGQKRIKGKLKYMVYNDYRYKLKVRRLFGVFGPRRYVIRRKDWVVVNNYSEVQRILQARPGEGKVRFAKK